MPMNLTLWIVAGLLAALALFSGATKGASCARYPATVRCGGGKNPARS